MNKHFYRTIFIMLIVGAQTTLFAAQELCFGMTLMLSILTVNRVKEIFIEPSDRISITSPPQPLKERGYARETPKTMHSRRFTELVHDIEKVKKHNGDQELLPRISGCKNNTNFSAHFAALTNASKFPPSFNRTKHKHRHR